MELRTFISQALLDIVGAVTDAQKKAGEGVIVPGGITQSFRSVEHGVHPLQPVEFEISVRIEETRGHEGKIGVVSSIVGAGVAGKSSKESGRLSVLRFRIPVQFPTSGKLQDS